MFREAENSQIGRCWALSMTAFVFTGTWLVFRHLRMSDADALDAFSSRAACVRFRFVSNSTAKTDVY